MRSALVVLTLAVFTALLAAPADAATRTYTLRSGPVHMGGFNVKFPKRPVKAPNVNGYVVGMTVDLVDKRGRAITIRDVMLHHVVFHRRDGRAPRGACYQSVQRADLRDGGGEARTCASRAATATGSGAATAGASPRC